MYRIKENYVGVKEIAEFVNAKYTGKNFDVKTVSSLNNPKNDSILFFSEKINSKFNFKDQIHYELKKLEAFDKIVLIARPGIKEKINVPVIESENPRHDFYCVVMKYFSENRFDSGIHDTAVIEKNVKIGKNVYIGPHCYVDKDVEIADNVGNKKSINHWKQKLKTWSRCCSQWSRRSKPNYLTFFKINIFYFNINQFRNSCTGI